MTRSDEVWQRTAAACALWRVTGDPDPVLPVLRAAWEENLYTRGTIAECLAGMGPAGRPVHDLLRTEVAAPRRHRAEPADTAAMTSWRTNGCCAPPRRH